MLFDQETHFCLLCKIEYYPDQRGFCQTINTVIPYCAQYDGPSTCAKCMKFYALSSNHEHCSYIENFFDNNCEEIKISDAVHCSICKPGYVFDEHDEEQEGEH